MQWRLAKSLEVLRKQINERWPQRDKSSDGTIGDPAHAARKSEHNPDENGLVRALDITNDPRSGLSSEALAELLRQRADPRVLYVISNRKIANPRVANNEWRPYHGTNPHNHHFHISVREENADDDSPWDLSGKLPATPDHTPPNTQRHAVLREGSKGAEVRQLQTLLKIAADGVFGPRTKAAVKEFQTAAGLLPDGIAGPATWDKLEQKE